jgi:hypothetical protein
MHQRCAVIPNLCEGVLPQAKDRANSESRNVATLKGGCPKKMNSKTEAKLLS